MASLGSFNTTSYEGRYLKFSWEVTSQSVANNTSTISWKLEGDGTGKSGYYTSGNFKVTIAGKTVYSSSTRINLYDGTVVASGTTTIAHNSDGTKSFSASAEAGIYYVAVNCKGSGSWSLPTIASTPTITNAPNITNLTNTFKINFSNPSKEGLFVGFGLVNSSYDYLIEGYASGSATSYTFTMTDEVKAQLIAAAGGNSVGNTCNVRFLISIYDESLGEGYHEVQRTFTVLDSGGGGGGGGGTTYNVTFNPTVVDTNSTTVALTGNSNTLVRYHSDAYFNVNATAVPYINIEESWQSCSNSGKRVTGSSGTIYNIWDNEFDFMVIGTIGSFRTTITKPIIDYIPLTCGISSHPNVNGGVVLAVSGSYFSGSFGAKSNTLSLQYRYKSSVSASYSSWASLTPTIDGNRYYANTIITALSSNNTYTIEVRATDELETITTSSMDVPSTPVFSWSKEDFEFNVPVSADKIVMGNNVYYDGIFGTTSGGTLIQHFVPTDDGGCIIGNGGFENGVGNTGLYGDSILTASNKHFYVLATNDIDLGSSDGDIVLSGEKVYLGQAPTISTSPTTDIWGGGYNILGAIRAMSNSYQLSPTVVKGSSYSSATTTAYLLGNNLTGFLNCSRSSAYIDGNISPNETVCTVQIPHGGKIKTAYGTSFCTADTGNLCSFYISSLSITSTHITFNINLSASAGSGKDITAYWCMPVVINPNAY